MVYAVIDTNVIVASLLTKHHDSATARVMDAVFSGKVIPLLNDEIVAEYNYVSVNLKCKKKISFLRVWASSVLIR